MIRTVGGWAATLVFLGAAPVTGQDPSGPDSTRLLQEAKSEQARFERMRELRLPLERSGGVSSCDLDFGRFCYTFDGGRDATWEPLPDHPDVIRRRLEVLGVLDSIQAFLPGDSWILGQRVYYRTELGRWDEAVRTARECRVERWWCEGLLGFALHVRGDFVAAEGAFDRMLGAMSVEQRGEWAELGWILEGGADETVEETLPGDPSRRRIWALADPYLLVEGNDRRSAHYARRTLAEIRSEARNPLQLAWGDDLTEITVRFGWTRGWTRRRSRFGTGGFPAVSGLHLPRGRDWMPPEEVVLEPSQLQAGEWIPEIVTPRNTYTPVYAPTLVPGQGQVGLLPRGDSIVAVGALGVPPPGEDEDPAFPARPDTVYSWPVQPPLPGPTRTGLFLLTEAGEVVAREGGIPGTEEGLLVRAPAGRYWLSLEALEPQDRRGARVRQGVRADTVPVDVPTLSDLLLLEPGVEGGDRIEDLLGRLLPRTTLASGEAVTVAWEIHGLGWSPETLQFELTILPERGGILSRLVDWFEGGDDPLRVEWTEAGPEEPGPWLRLNRLELRNLDPGSYRIALRVRLRGREDLFATRRVEVTDRH